MRKADQKRTQTIRENLDDESKYKLLIAPKELMKRILENKKESRDKSFDEGNNFSMIHPSIMESKALRLCKKAIYQELEKGLTIFAIFVTNVNIERLCSYLINLNMIKK